MTRHGRFETSHRAASALAHLGLQIELGQAAGIVRWRHVQGGNSDGRIRRLRGRRAEAFNPTRTCSALGYELGKLRKSSAGLSLSLNRRTPEDRLPSATATRGPASCHVLVAQHRIGRRHGNAYPRDLPAVPRLDFRRELLSSGPQAAWNGLLFIVLLFLCVLLHEFGHIFTARAFRRQDTRRDSAADRRRGAARTHTGETERRISDRHRRARRQRRHRVHCWCSSAARICPPSICRARKRQCQHDRPPGGG